MRQIRTLTFALGFLALIAVPVSGQDVTGTWVLAVDLGAGGGGDVVFVLVQEGAEITGTYSGQTGDGVEVTGTVEDGVITFSFLSDLAGEVTYQGTIEDGVFKGTCLYSDLGEGTFEGRKSS
mgnify:CR=1 FL=1